MDKYHVSVSVDEDNVRDYVVEAQSSEDALNIATEYVRDLVGGYVDEDTPEDEFPEPDGEISRDDLGPEGKAVVDSCRDKDSERGSAMVGFLAVSAFFVVVASGFADLVARLVTLR